jgi:type III secretory pathway lipoprotein EscJ
VRSLLVVVVLVACAPVVDGPAERQRAGDRDDAARLTAQLQALPGVVRAEVVVRRPIADPLATAPAAPGGLSIVAIVDDQADRAAIETHAKQLAAASAPGLAPTIVVEVGAIRPELAQVGPFTVEHKSKGPLKAILAIALALVVVLAGFIAISRTRTNRAPR